MAGDVVECFNCGRANPAWAQVCRSCGVALRHGVASVAPGGPIPTDRNSLISIGAVIGTILAAVLIGFILSSMYPSDPSAIGATPTPSATPRPSFEPSLVASATPDPSETPVPTPALPGTLVFGTELDATQNVTQPVDTFTPGMTFAHSITVPETFGVAQIGEQVVRILEGGGEEEMVAAAGNQLRVNSTSTVAGYTAGDARTFISSWGTGLYKMRVYRGTELLAEGEFRLSEG